MTHTLVNPQVDRSRPVETAGQGSRGEDRQGDRCRDRHPRRAHGLDPVRLCARSAGAAVDLPRHQQGGRALRLRLQRRGRRAGPALHLPPLGDPPECRLADGLSAVGAVRRDRRDGDFRRCAGAVGAGLHPPRRRTVQRPLQPHRHHAADHASVLDQEPGQGRVHDGARLRDREIDQHRPASARPGDAGRADPIHRVLPRLPAGERGRRGAGRLRRDRPRRRCRCGPCG